LGNVGVIGLGRIGGGLVRSLTRTRDYDLAGYDPNADAVAAVAEQARGASSPREAAAGADVVFVAVFDDAQVRDALSGRDGVLAADPPPRAVVILSTVAPETIRWAGEQGAAAGIDVLDCGVTGGGAIEHASIAAMVGGDEETYEFAKPFIDGFATPTVYMGPLGNGMKAKLARNMIVFGMWSVVGEAARVARAAGVDLDKLIEVSDAGDRWSGGPTALLKRGIRPEEEPRDDEDLARRRGLAAYAHKDVRAALALAAELGLELPVATLVERRFDDAVGLG
jgi:3-hydroxyisobutyrate dehydrogenase